MQKEKLCEIIKKRVIYMVVASICVLAGAVQIVFMVVEHELYSDGVWYMLCAAWFVVAAILVYKYVKNLRAEKELEKKVADFKKQYNIK